MKIDTKWISLTDFPPSEKDPMHIVTGFTLVWVLYPISIVWQDLVYVLFDLHVPGKFKGGDHP
jgi:hypothetical protein